MCKGTQHCKKLFKDLHVPPRTMNELSHVLVLSIRIRCNPVVIVKRPMPTAARGRLGS